MKLTPEEKAQRRTEAAAQKKLMATKFPGARLHDGDIQLILDEGDEFGLEVRVKNLAQVFCIDDAIGGDVGWCAATINIHSIEPLSALIAALVARLNAKIDDANANIARCEVRKLEKANV